VSAFHLSYVRFYPDVENSRVRVAVGLSGRTDNTEIKARFTIDGKVQAETSIPAAGDQTAFDIRLDECKLWTPDAPNLYNVLLELRQNGNIYDRVLAYFGMRNIAARDGQILLNGRPCYLRLVLDQGYFDDGVYTAPSDATLKRDVGLAKALGFNGVRKHQKIEDPRYYYWCDKLGLLVWAEMPAAFEFSDASVVNFACEWPHVVRANFNHPSIITWVPFNESWGIEGVHDQDRPQEFLGQVVALTRSLDPTRPVIDNSGWSHVDTDIVDLHEYSQDSGFLRRVLSDVSPPSRRLPGRPHRPPIMADGFAYNGQPVVVSEYGGIALGSKPGWGYGRPARDSAELIERFGELTRAILASKSVAGYCYTQLYDVEQETNGLLTSGREPKADIEAIAQANRRRDTIGELLPAQ